MLKWAVIIVGILIALKIGYAFWRATQVGLLHYLLGILGFKSYGNFTSNILTAFIRGRRVRTISNQKEMEIRPLRLHSKRHITKNEILNDLEDVVKKGGHFNLSSHILQNKHAVYLVNPENEDELYTLLYVCFIFNIAKLATVKTAYRWSPYGVGVGAQKQKLSGFVS